MPSVILLTGIWMSLSICSFYCSSSHVFLPGHFLTDALTSPGLCLLLVKCWKLVGQQDTCLAGLDFHQKLVKQSEAQLSDARNKLESVQTQKESEIGALKKEKTGSENKLRLCEKSRDDLVRDIKVKEDKIETYETELRKVKGELNDMMTKFAKIKAEYTSTLAREKTLTSEKDDLKNSLSLSQNAGTGHLQKDQDLEALNKTNMIRIRYLEEKNEFSLSRIQQLETNLLGKKDFVGNSNDELIDDELISDKLINKTQEEQPKEDIMEKPSVKSKESDKPPNLETKEENYLKGHGEF